MTSQGAGLAQGRTTRTRPLGVRTLSSITIASGALGLLCAIGILLTPPMVSVTRFSHPFDAVWFSVTQLLFAVQHLAMVAGVLGLSRLLVPRPGGGGQRRWQPAPASCC